MENIENSIIAENLGKTYKNRVRGLTDLNLNVSKGEIFGFLGPNGAGKTTTVRLLNGTLTPTKGKYRILGINESSEEIRKRTATLAEMAKMYEHLSVMDNLLFFASVYDLEAAAAKERIRELLTRMELWEKRDLTLGSFSTGMKKRVQLTRTLLHRPELLFLDEPTSGLDPESSLQVTELIKELAEEQGITVFLCTHNLPLAERICTRYGFINKSKMIASGTKEDLKKLTGAERRVVITTKTGEESYNYEKEEEINSIIKRTMDAGATILEVARREPDLEELYFAIVKGDKE